MSTLGFVVLVWYLVPEFPWWISAFFGFVWTPIYSYIGARMIGLTGSPQGASFPYLREGSFYLSGYQGAAVWFAPIPLFQWGYEAAAFKQLELTRTHFGSIVKLAGVTLLIMFVCSFIFWSFIWKLGPIPSSAYPYVQKFWPFHATMQAFWAKSTLAEGGNELIRTIIRWEYVLTGALGSAGNFGRAGALALAGRPVLRFHRRRGRVATLSAAQLHWRIARPLSLAEALWRGALAGVRSDSPSGLFVRNGLGRHVFHRVGADF